MTLASYLKFLRQQLIGWSLLFGILGCLATLLGFLGQYHWILGLFAHFRVQYAAGLLAITLVLLLLKQRQCSVILALFALVNIVLIAPLFIHPKDAPITANTGTRIRAMLLNVNTNEGDPVLAAQAIRAADPDILLLEEISREWIHDLASLLKLYPYAIERPQNDNFGIALYSRIPLVNTDVRHLTESGGLPTIITSIQTPQGPLTLIGTHPLPPIGANYWRERNEQLNALADLETTGPTLLLGDLNATPWDYYFQQLLKQSMFHDSARGHGWQPSWPVQLPLLLIPIDQCLYSEGVVITNRQTGSNAGSDHYPLIIDFALTGSGGE
ncbi:endonuclease/exonuclease/phosphatase family protein [Cerasicoccus arenae]|uniref:Endonuclease/exonuclease/phosphatase domain-containing protein n=1 Tax=Cerasicoccus arenae TaxID=424488 RepID=A0A8J3DK90_9BACT|nr:endonuclease/exonuclease/phosphatase family protein [Cerasicoccus arenae]MBK1856825.1 endonuclease/exonuclease/phosphatase family protein [Cerasicoccus arenae]GHC14027.1 hypothetical protein GCM10007047_34110 [Cerasicoccus arenae]